MQYHTLTLCGLTRKLPLIQIGRNTKLASLCILGDVKLVNTLADQMAEKLKKIDFDYLVGPEVRVLPLIHGVALRLGHSRYVVCRESVKPYMVFPITIKPLPHFPKHVKPMTLNGTDADLIKNKKVVLMDDVVSTGVTMRQLIHLMDKMNAKVVKKYAAVKQGKQFDDLADLVYFGELPIFKNPS